LSHARCKAKSNDSNVAASLPAVLFQGSSSAQALVGGLWSQQHASGGWAVCNAVVKRLIYVAKKI